MYHLGTEKGCTMFMNLMVKGQLLDARLSPDFSIAPVGEFVWTGVL